MGSELVDLLVPDSPAFTTIVQLEGYEEMVETPGAPDVIFKALKARFPPPTNKPSWSLAALVARINSRLMGVCEPLPASR